MDGVERRDLEEDGDPENPQAAGSDQSDHHRRQGVADAPDGAYDDIHQSAEGVEGADYPDTVHSGGNDGGTVE